MDTTDIFLIPQQKKALSNVICKYDLNVEDFVFVENESDEIIYYKPEQIYYFQIRRCSLASYRDTYYFYYDKNSIERKHLYSEHDSFLQLLETFENWIKTIVELQSTYKSHQY